MNRTALSLLLLLITGPIASADRYDDLMAKWGSNGNGGYDDPDAMRTAWVAVPRNDALLDGYEINGNKQLVDDCHAAVDYFVRTTPKPNPNGLPAYLILSVVPVPGIEVAGEEFRHIDLIAHFIEVVRNHQPALAEYNDDCEHYLRFLEDTLLTKWDEYIITEATQEPTDFYYPGAAGITQPRCTTCTSDPYDAGSGAHALLSNPNNKQSDFGKAMLRLWRITGKEKYKDIVRAVALNFKSKLIRTEGPTGTYYSWHYWDPIGDCDYNDCSGRGEPRFGVWIEHRSGYGCIDMEFVTECYREGIVFSRTDVQRFVRTNRDIMWDGVTTGIDHGTWMASDGNPAVDYGGLLLPLAPYDTTGRLTDLLYNYFNANPTGWNALKLPAFVRVMQMTEPPDTVTWQGPLEVLDVEPLNRGAVKLTFYNEVDPATLTDMANFSFSRGIEALRAEVDPVDAHIVTVYTTDQTPGAGMRLRIRNVKDVYGNVTFAYAYGNQPYEYDASDLPAGIDDAGDTGDVLNRLPNPVRTGTGIAVPGDAVVQDHTGRVVFRAVSSAGVQHVEPLRTFTWYGTDTSGRPLTPGMYYLRTGTTVHRMMLVN